MKNKRFRFLFFLTLLILACVCIFLACIIYENCRTKYVNGLWFNDRTFSTQKDGKWKGLPENNWAFFDNNGTAVNGWNQIDGIWYYFNSKCIMLTDQKVGKYYVDASGVSANNEWIGRKYYNTDGVYDRKISEEALTNFFEPTLFTKIGDTYYVVDSQGCRLMCSKDYTLPPTKWRIIDDDLYYPHSVAGDGNILIVDDTYNARWKIYKKDSQLHWKLSQTIKLDKDCRPHYTYYDDENCCFYSIESTNDDLYVIKDTNNGVKISKKVSIPDVGGYTRSFYINDGYMYIASEVPGENIVVIDYKKDFKVIKKIPVKSEYVGMNGLLHVGKYWYATITRNADGAIEPQLLMTTDLDNLSTGENVRMLSEKLNIKGIPYFFSANGDSVYLTVIEALGYDQYQENSILQLSFDRVGGGYRPPRRFIINGDIRKLLTNSNKV